MSPGFDDLKELAKILASDQAEEKLQEFLQFRPKLLMGFAGYRYSGDLALIVKPPIGTKYFADFGILQASQAGVHVVLVEIERSECPLFTQRGTPARTLQSAMGQVQDWQQWLKTNYSTFIQDVMDDVKKFPVHPEHTHNGRRRFRSPEEIEKTWQMYSGYKTAILHYVIIAGRWANLSEKHRERLLFLNSKGGDTTIYTYDEVARRAYARPFIIG